MKLLITEGGQQDVELQYWLLERDYVIDDLVNVTQFPHVKEGLGLMKTPALLTEQGDILYSLNSIKLYIHNYYLHTDPSNLRIDV